LNSPSDQSTLGRAPIIVEPPTDEARHLWKTVGELAVIFGADEEWCLIGGLMVQLHAYEHGSESRPTSDIDVLGDARHRPSMTERLAQTLKDLGGELSLPSSTDEKIGYQFLVRGETVEVLGPEGLRDDPRTLAPFETIMVKGGTQALKRTEGVQVSTNGAAPVIVRRPSLLGAILIKAKALAVVRGKHAEHRQDLIRLLSFVSDPRALAHSDRLTRNERRWLKAVEKDLAFDDLALLELFSEAEIRRASQAFTILAS
jgi:hypothetical protein